METAAPAYHRHVKVRHTAAERAYRTLHKWHLHCVEDFAGFALWLGGRKLRREDYCVDADQSDCQRARHLGRCACPEFDPVAYAKAHPTH